MTKWTWREDYSESWHKPAKDERLPPPELEIPARPSPDELKASQADAERLRAILVASDIPVRQDDPNKFRLRLPTIILWVLAGLAVYCIVGVLWWWQS